MTEHQTGGPAGASAAIYGVRAANGVVVVTTRRMER